MGTQSSRIWLSSKDHKEIYLNGKYHDKMYIGSTLAWQKLANSKLTDGFWGFQSAIYDEYYALPTKYSSSTTMPVSPDALYKGNTSVGFTMVASLPKLSQDYYVFDAVCDTEQPYFIMFCSYQVINGNDQGQYLLIRHVNTEDGKCTDFTFKVHDETTDSVMKVYYLGSRDLTPFYGNYFYVKTKSETGYTLLKIEDTIEKFTTTVGFEVIKYWDINDALLTNRYYAKNQNGEIYRVLENPISLLSYEVEYIHTCNLYKAGSVAPPFGFGRLELGYSKKVSLFENASDFSDVYSWSNGGKDYSCNVEGKMLDVVVPTEIISSYVTDSDGTKRYTSLSDDRCAVVCVQNCFLIFAGKVSAWRPLIYCGVSGAFPFSSYGDGYNSAQLSAGEVLDLSEDYNVNLSGTDDGTLVFMFPGSSKVSFGGSFGGNTYKVVNFANKSVKAFYEKATGKFISQNYYNGKMYDQNNKQIT